MTDHTRYLVKILKQEVEPEDISASPMTFLLREDVEDPQDLENQEKSDKGANLFSGLLIFSIFGFIFFNFN